MGSTDLLIVDDDIVFANRMSIALSERGFQVRKANTRHEALAAIEDSPPDFATIDLRLGDGSGLDVLAALHSVRPEARAIILSGYGNLPCTVAAIRFGAFDCLAKPADADDVAQALLAAPGSLPPPPANALSPTDASWLHIERVFKDCGGNVSETSRRLNMHRRTLQRILARRAVDQAAAPLMEN
jgi:two-component system response regulator RegA